ncbi:unnamed protein product [Symbiodinium pilosum]|uniref:PDZ domain-containing protein n=1 Tax=Symbiodinium pilosum TaxID=2952 RepID=A0A812NG03_SYMPI|nr:unnamed protein product [Symbiodinium pilosum]
MEVPGEREMTSLTGHDLMDGAAVSSGPVEEPPRTAGGDTEEMTPNAADRDLDNEHLNAESPSNNAEEFNVVLQKHPGMRLGMECVRVGDEVVVAHVAEGMVVNEWNAKNPDQTVKVGDVVRAVNQISPDDVQTMLAELRTAVVLSLRFERGPREVPKPKEDDGSSTSKIKPSGGDLIRIAQKQLMEDGGCQPSLPG